MNLKNVLYVLFLFLAIPLFVSAHGSGASYEEVVEEKLIDIGYSPEMIEAGQPARFDFNLLDNTTSEEIEFSDIWVRIQQERKIFFAGSVHKTSFGTTGFSFTFPEKGLYEVYVRYQNNSESIIETSLPIEVAAKTPDGEESDVGGNGTLFGLGGLFVGFIVGFLISRKQKLTP